MRLDGRFWSISEAIKPILAILVDDNITIETDLTDEEKETIRHGRKEYESGNFVPLDSLYK